MRLATRCRETPRRRLGTIVAAFVALFVALATPDARAGDTDAAQAPAQRVAACARAASFRTVVDVGHGTEAPGALSARGIDEYDFNLRLAKEIEKQLHAAGFDSSVLMITSDKPPRGLFKRVARANALNADLFLAVHHDSVPDRMLETWQVDGKQEHYNDRFPGHSLFVSYANADRAGSLAFAHQLGLALKAHGLQYTPHYTEKFMGSRRRELLDRDAGVYRFDALVVLKDTRMPAALLEAGSIVNRHEELLLATPEHEAIMADAVVEAVDEFCTARAKPSAGSVVAAKKPDQVPTEFTGTAKKPDRVPRGHPATAKKPDPAKGEHAEAESGTWSFLRNLKLLTSAHMRTREAATK
jgi:N-acetylmuramoyl-L-alanine amidase